MVLKVLKISLKPWSWTMILEFSLKPQLVIVISQIFLNLILLQISIVSENVNLNNELHLEGGWIGVVEQFKNSPNKDYLTLDYLNVKNFFFQ